MNPFQDPLFVLKNNWRRSWDSFTKWYLHINRRECKVIPHAKIQHLTYANKIYFILKTKSVINWPDDGIKAKSGHKRDDILVWYYKVVTKCYEPRTFKYKAENILYMCIDHGNRVETVFNELINKDLQDARSVLASKNRK